MIIRDDHYVLDGKTPVLEPDLLKWARMFEDSSGRRVAQDMIGDVRVSTVFLGLDHNFDDEGPPLLFETMVFGGSLDEETERYATWEQAEAGHAAMIERVRAPSPASLSDGG